MPPPALPPPEVVPAGVAELSAGVDVLRAVDGATAPCCEEVAVGVGWSAGADEDAAGALEVARLEAEGEGADDEAGGEGEAEGCVGVGDDEECGP